MADQDIKQIVKDKYGKAALKVVAGGEALLLLGERLLRRRRGGGSDHLQPLRGRPRRRRCRPRPSPPRSAAATRRRWPSSGPARRCSTSARAAASTCCSRPGASGRAGKAYGLDMTDEMLALARENQRKAGVDNVEFLKGEIEADSPSGRTRWTSSSPTASSICRPTRTACSPRRSGCFEPGGRFAVSDVVVRGEVPARDPPERRALDRLRGRRARGGRVPSEARQGGLRGRRSRADPHLSGRGCPRLPRPGRARRGSIVSSVDGKFMSAFVRARKPRPA